MRVLIAVALLMMCGALAQRIGPAPKQEKAQSDCLDKKGFWIAGCVWTPSKEHLPFDLPAKQWDGPDTHAKNTCAEAPHDCALVYIAVPNHHVSCKDVAPDWKQRVLLDSADGKHHCYAFYLLSQR